MCFGLFVFFVLPWFLDPSVDRSINQLFAVDLASLKVPTINGGVLEQANTTRRWFLRHKSVRGQYIQHWHIILLRVVKFLRKNEL